MHDFTEDEIQRYARHIVLPEVGGVGQTRLLQSSVLVIGAGGLGTPLIMYLAAAGVGRIGIVDDDTVDLSNLQRQVIHETAAVGRPKTESAAARARAINPGVEIVTHRLRLDAGNAAGVIAGYDLVADGSDNFDTRYLVNDACHFAGKTLVSAAILRFDGQVATFRSFDKSGPCYRCLFPEPPPPDLAPSCSQAGVFGALAGTVGSLQAVEVVKELLGIGDSLVGRLILYDALAARFQTIRVARDPNCALCSDKPTIRDLGHAA